MNKIFFKKHLKLIVSSAVVGFLISILSGGILNILKGVYFTIVMSLGLVVTNYLNLNGNKKIRDIKFGYILLLSIIVGLTAFCGAEIFNYLQTSDFDGEIEFSLGNLTGVKLALVCLIYTFFMYFTYFLRWHVSKKFRSISVVFVMFFSAAIISLLRAYMMKRMMEFFYFFIFSVAPFCIFWLSIAIKYDPGWSEKRWAETFSKTEKTIDKKLGQ